jgi:hypothetical protein
LTRSPGIEDNVSIMARPPRLEFPGALCHLTSRGKAGKAISQGRADRERSLEQLDLQLSVREREGLMRESEMCKSDPVFCIPVRIHGAVMNYTALPHRAGHINLVRGRTFDDAT